MSLSPVSSYRGMSAREAKLWVTALEASMPCVSISSSCSDVGRASGGSWLRGGQCRRHQRSAGRSPGCGLSSGFRPAALTSCSLCHVKVSSASGRPGLSDAAFLSKPASAVPWTPTECCRVDVIVTSPSCEKAVKSSSPWHLDLGPEVLSNPFVNQGSVLPEP